MPAGSPHAESIARVAVPVPVRRLFDYLCDPSALPARGARVVVPFGRHTLIGIVLEIAATSGHPTARLKRVARVLDDEAVLGEPLTALLEWSARYYHYPVGEVLQAALPAAARRGAPLAPSTPAVYRVTERGDRCAAAELKRAPVQYEVLRLVAGRGGVARLADIAGEIGGARRAVAALVCKGWLRREEGGPPAAPAPPASGPGPVLSQDQQRARQQIVDALGRFQVFVLHGVTGSGKTEVYLHVVKAVLQRGGQALVLVPEIALTPQLVARFRQRVGVTIAVMHSGLSDRERHDAWWAARGGAAAVVLGTRSAVFAPMPRLGVIIIDEEHDASYKQQEGFRYHARDIAIMRARRAEVPVVLGSATPSLETLVHADSGRYRLLELPSRAGRAALPQVTLLDLRRLPAPDGLSPVLLDAVERCLGRGEQCLIFINRRGFAPVVMCAGCGWQAQCRRCDARLTLHKRSARLRCHHCGADLPAPKQCPGCGSDTLYRVGTGTQRVEEALAKRFPKARLVRVDRDTTSGRGQLEAQLNDIAEGRADILIGTQMLAKGHDFPGLTLVGIVNVDQGLYSLDFRAPERLFQQLVQVAGRAGRGQRAGHVLVQTLHPENPYFEPIVRHDYRGLAALALQERRQAHYPPFSHLALLRADSPRAEEALAFLREARSCGRRVLDDRPGVAVMDPVPSPMERRAGRYRAQLLVVAQRRQALHPFLDEWLNELDARPGSRRLRWSLDVDPLEMY